MCFSPEVSFISSSLLLVVGAFTIEKVKKPKHIPFTVIPLFFGIHQFIEGAMRFSLSGTCFTRLNISPEWFVWTQSLRKYLFFLFSQVIRPSRIPISIWLVETDFKQKRLLWVLSIIWLCISAYLGACLLIFGWHASIIENHIRYVLSFPPELKVLVSTLYVMAIVVSPLLSSNKLIRRLWYILALSLAITFFFFKFYLISVRCFFASLISIYVYRIIHRINWEKWLKSEEQTQ